MSRPRRLASAILLASVLPAVVSATQAALPVTAETLARTMNVRWTLAAAFLVLLMPLGFALVSSGFTRAQNVVHTMTTGVLLYVVGLLGYWACGFAFQMGGAGVPSTLSATGALSREIGLTVSGRHIGMIGFERRFLGPGSHDEGLMALFLFQAMVMTVAAVIPAGALAERWRLQSLVLFGCAMSMVIYPVFANWVWGGGWLSRLGVAGFGHGVVDFAGSSVVHLVGGVAALAGAMIVGPRARKFAFDGRPTAIPGHHLPMAMAGTLMLGVGWLGLTTGMAVTRLDAPLAVAVTNTALASAAAVLAATLLVWWRFGTPDPSLISNGLLAGLVSISAGCVFVSTGAAVFIGLTAGLLVVWSVFLVERHLRVDDPVGAISIHGTCGVWGLLAVGLFANGTYGAGWNGQPGGVTGLFYGGAAQLGAQAIGAVVCVAFVLATVFVLFKALDATVGNRVRPEAEFEGLDVTEMGTIAYPDFSLAPSRHEPAPLFGDRHH